MIVRPSILIFRLFNIVTCLLLIVHSGCIPTRQLLSWNSLEGPYAQNVSVVIMDNEDQRTIYAAFHGGDFYASSDFGKIWQKRSTIAPGSDVYSIVQDPDQHARLFAATSEGLFTSTTGGTDWKYLSVIPDTIQPCRALTIDPWDPVVLYAGIDENGLYKSTSGGLSWSPINGNLPERDLATIRIEEIIIHPSRPDLLFALGSTVGVIRSADGGQSWIRLTDRFMAGGTSVSQLIVHQTDPDVMCIGTGGGDVYKSTDGGMNWILTYSGPGFAPVQGFVGLPSEIDHLAAGTAEGVIVSTDFGSAWTMAGEGFPRIPTKLTAIPDSTMASLILYGEGVGIIASWNRGESWEQIDKGLGGSAIPVIMTSPGASVVFVTVGTAVYRYSSGIGWESASDGLPGTSVTGLAIHPGADSILYASTLSGVFISSDNGKMWNRLGNSLSGTPFRTMAAHPSITNRLFGMTDEGMYISTDRGMSWLRTAPSLRGILMRSIAFHPRNAGIVGIGTAENGVFRSLDGGLHWEAARYGIPEHDILAITFTSDDQRTFFAWTAGGSGYRSANQGIEWEAHPTPWKSPTNFSVAFDPRVPSGVIAVIDNERVFYSDTGGEKWSEITTDPLPHEILRLYWDETSKILFAGTKTKGLFRISLGESIGKR